MVPSGRRLAWFSKGFHPHAAITAIRISMSHPTNFHALPRNRFTIRRMERTAGQVKPGCLIEESNCLDHPKPSDLKSAKPQTSIRLATLHVTGIMQAAPGHRPRACLQMVHRQPLIPGDPTTAGFHYRPIPHLHRKGQGAVREVREKCPISEWITEPIRLAVENTRCENVQCDVTASLR